MHKMSIHGKSSKSNFTQGPYTIKWFFQFISEPTVVPKDFRLDPLKPVEPHKAHFIWEAVDTAEQKIRGDFKGYKVTYR